MMNHVPGGRSSVPWEDGFVTYDERKEFLSEMYEANFMVGDIYETIALVTFGHLVMGVLKKKIDKMKAIFKQKTQHREDSEQLQEYIVRLNDAMKTLTVAGVKLFAMSCLLQGLYTLIITTFAFDFPTFKPELFSRDSSNLGTFQKPDMKNMAHYFFLGAGFIASFAAIGNILISVFLTPRGWSEIQSNLMYSSCLCLECLLIAIFHIKGLNADEEWYGDYELSDGLSQAEGGSLKENLLPKESK